MTERDIDQIAWAVTDLRQCLTALGVKSASIHIHVPPEALAALARASAGSRWAGRRPPDGALRIAEAAFSAGR